MSEVFSHEVNIAR